MQTSIGIVFSRAHLAIPRPVGDRRNAYHQRFKFYYPKEKTHQAGAAFYFNPIIIVLRSTIAQNLAISQA